MSEVTGRDRYIILTALAIAIETISTVPEERQPSSNQTDMKRLLQAFASNDAELAMCQAHALWVIHGKPDVWPGMETRK